jgi:hypothetical protein
MDFRDFDRHPRRKRDASLPSSKEILALHKKGAKPVPPLKVPGYFVRGKIGPIQVNDKPGRI